MATHNKEDGTGGLDASIQFEQDRAEVGTHVLHALETGTSRRSTECWHHSFQHRQASQSRH